MIRARIAPGLLLGLALAGVAGEPEKKLEEKTVEVRREGTIGGVAMAWSATAGTLVLREDGNKPKASVFYVSYVKEGEDPATRPLTFAFNGGPGSSSVWLHLGALGPRRVATGDEGEAPHPPGLLADNPDAWLDLTDVVCVDPVTTGFSRPAEGEDAKQFHGVEEDIAWMSEFIRAWVSRSGRWSSPKVLVGESYGTTRVSALAHHLAERHGLQVNGVMLVSPVLEFGTIRFDPGNDDPYWLFLPTYATTAWYHQRLAPALQRRPVEEVAAQAERWARTVYLPALASGDRLAPAEQEKVLKELAAWTGLAPEWLQRNRMRVGMGRFAKELLRGEGKVLGRFDSRYTGGDADQGGDGPGYDPSYAAVQGPFTAAINDYLRRELGWASEAPYEVLTGRVHPWSYPAQNRYLSVAERLRDALIRNPRLRVLACLGLYDLATPFAALDHTVSRLALPAELRGNVQRATYRSGHMMYLRRADREKLKADAAKFYRWLGPRADTPEFR